MIYTFADCELDTDQMELKRSGRPVPLEPQVFDLLRYLVTHPNRVVTKDEILDNVWNGRIVSESALSSRIKSSRQAIGDNGRDQTMIKTVHGRGFRLVAPVATGNPSDDASGREKDVSTFDDGPPSIAVMPFRNLSETAEQDYLADGITDELTMLLSRLRWLQVLARDSSYAFKDDNGDSLHLGRALGVRYLLNGTVLRAEQRIRVAIRLINALDGAQVWANHYDREMANVFDLQDEIAQAIAGALELELTGVEEALAQRKAPENLTAWDYYLRGRAKLFTFTEDGLADAERLFARAIAIEPGLARAHSGQAYVYIQDAFYGDPAQRESILEAALAAARRAVAADERDAWSHFTLGRVYSLRRETADAERELQIALTINPSFAQAHFAIGFTLVSSRRPAESIPYFERFSVLSPWDPHSWTNHHMRAVAHYWLGELETAEHYIRRSVSQPNVTWWPFATLVSILGSAGQIENAQAAFDRLRERMPTYSIATARDSFFFLDDPENEERYLAGLRTAGVPEK
jgi:TolB-like protein